ncbi:hypothetical protein FOA52_004889 [Chlamydomonas sp. UWO 241]|nr:hypothetical protein FOA52_004889 [Chlamydomonas sp. UWO 241]
MQACPTRDAPPGGGGRAPWRPPRALPPQRESQPHLAACDNRSSRTGERVGEEKSPKDSPSPGQRQL